MRKASFNKNYDIVYNACLRVLTENMECKIKDKSRERGFVFAKKGSTIWSYGEDIEVTLEEQKDKKIRVNVYSYTKAVQIIDWGVNSKNEEQFINTLKKQLTQ